MRLQVLRAKDCCAGATEEESWGDERWWSEEEAFGVNDFESNAVAGHSKDTVKAKFLL